MRGAGQIAELARDRRARRRRDRQHRPGAPRAARLARGDRGRQGGADRATCAPGGDRGRPGRASRCSSRTCAPTLATVTFGRAATSSCSRRGRRRRRARSTPRGERIELELAFTRRTTCCNLLAAVAAARAIGVAPGGRVDGRVLGAARRAHRAARRGHRHQRLLQRQPDVHARRPRRPRRDRAATGGASRCSATCSSSGPDERALHREIGAHAAPRGRRRCSSRSGRARPRRRRRSTARRTRRRRARRPRCSRDARCSPATRVLVKASRGVGLERVAEALAATPAPARRRLMGEVLIAGTASLLICIFLSPKFIEFLREREFGQHIREEGPEEHHAKAGTPTMGGIIIFTADRGAVPDPDRLRLARRSACSAWRSRARCSASPTTT